MKFSKLVALLLIMLLIIANLCICNSVSKKNESYSKGEYSYYRIVGTIDKNSDGTFNVDYISNINSVMLFMNECVNKGYTGAVYRLNNSNRRFGIYNAESKYYVFCIDDGEISHYGIIRCSENNIEGEEVRWDIN